MPPEAEPQKANALTESQRAFRKDSGKAATTRLITRNRDY